MKMPKPLPPPFVILCDTREQKVLPFPKGTPTKVTTLYPGDYSVERLERVVAWERKTITDLIGTLFGKSQNADGSYIARQKKFIEELTAMRCYRFRSVIVTEPLAKIEAHMYQSRVEPSAVIRLIAAIENLTGVPFRFFDNAEQAARVVLAEAFEAWELSWGGSSIKYIERKLRPERLKPRCA